MFNPTTSYWSACAKEWAVMYCVLSVTISTPFLQLFDLGFGIVPTGWNYYTPTRREGAILQSPCPSVCPFVRPFTLSLKMSQLLLEEMILFLIHDFGMVTCPCLPFPGLLHIYFLFTVWLRIFHVFMAFSGNECWDIYKFDTNERVGVATSCLFFILLQFIRN